MKFEAYLPFILLALAIGLLFGLAGGGDSLPDLGTEPGLDCDRLAVEDLTNKGAQLILREEGIEIQTKCRIVVDESALEGGSLRTGQLRSQMRRAINWESDADLVQLLVGHGETVYLLRALSHSVNPTDRLIGFYVGATAFFSPRTIDGVNGYTVYLVDKES